MRVIKPTLYTVAVATIVGCSSVPKIQNIMVPAPENNAVTMSAKKAPLTKDQENNWHHLDLATDSIPGMSVHKAYDFLKGKKGVEVVVGVVDSGTDLAHEDLKDVAWVNADEIAGNGIDDDKNGYVDDIHGWNFLGKSYKEHLEYERILLNPSIADEATLAEVKKYQAKQVEQAKGTKTRYEGMLSNVVFADDALTKKLGKSDYSFDEVSKITPDTEELKSAMGIAGWANSYGMTVAAIRKELSDGLDKAKKTIKGELDSTDYRAVVGDNAYDIKDKPGYGDGNIGHSEKGESHGTHVSGIIGATRNNGKGMDGVANVKLMAVRSVSGGDEYDKDVALGIRYAVDNGAKVINTSFGKGFSPNKEWVYDAIKYAAKKDVLIVNAAGNDGKNIDIEKTFPNDAPDQVNEISDNFLTVGAMSSNYNEELPASFTNYGKLNVDVFAPGVQIYATTPEGEYGKKSGTSMASPATAGVAALIRSYYPELSASQVKHIIMNSGTKINLEVMQPGSVTAENPNGTKVPFSDLSVSGRVVNAYNALKMADKMVNTK
ncbi:S8 family peptidase [Tenacibaculum sp. M341]|uniref:S8 family peptidase n=1 Tax=Tenacibaculum sp. M341 TaxID=2530339 RepID=UPI001046EDA8|nr:S8 family peptidase [Tenacibaculum sp. M341]TCI93031.1 peptidase S8 [Tenacibaculum sp. M341]